MPPARTPWLCVTEKLMRLREGKFFGLADLSRGRNLSTSTTLNELGGQPPDTLQAECIAGLLSGPGPTIRGFRWGGLTPPHLPTAGSLPARGEGETEKPPGAGFKPHESAIRRAKLPGGWKRERPSLIEMSGTDVDRLESLLEGQLWYNIESRMRSVRFDSSVRQGDGRCTRECRMLEIR